MKERISRRIPAFFLCLAMILTLTAAPAEASVWPENVSISAEGGILMDADSGAVLYGKNIHTAYFPASITKILTALIVIENCSLDDVVTFSHDAVFNVEVGSSSAALDVGDRLTVRDCLYAMLLKSANESANALAEHTAGSVAAFADMMNARAAALGCTDSHFNNPSGLNDPEHYTSAHDMALIAQAAFENEIFVEIDSTLYYDLPVTKRNPEGLRIYPGHQMLKKNSSRYYPGIIGGKTGYTSLAGNTLVTCAERDGMKLIVVVLNGHQTHYTDTRALLNFGFQNFKTVSTSDIDTAYTSVENDMTIGGLPTTDLSILQLMSGGKVTLPLNAEFSDVSSSISYDLSDNVPGSVPDKAVAEIRYEYEGRQIGETYLLLNEAGADATEPAVEVTTAAPESAGEHLGAEADSEAGLEKRLMRSGNEENQDGDTDVEAAGPGEGNGARAAGSADGNGARAAGSADEEGARAARSADEEGARAASAESRGRRFPAGLRILCIVAAAAVVLGAGLVILKIRIEKREEAERLERYHRRRQRLEDIGMSTAEFDLYLQEKRNKKK